MKPAATRVVLWCVLLVFWLILNQSLAPGDLLIGGLLALVACLVYGRLQASRPGKRGIGRRLLVAVRLLFLVVLDIIRSNVAVGRIILTPGDPGISAGFLEVPLELEHPAGLSVLACIITATPGTAWAGYDSGRSVLTLHILDLVDADGLVREIKGRYENRLKEIFE